MSLLRTDDVAVRFGGVNALGGVDLSAEAGAVTGLIGPNGAGKTTLFNVVSGLQSPTRGRVYLDERDITSRSVHQRARLGLARTFQRLEIFGSLTVRDNVQVAVELHRRFTRLRAGTPNRLRAGTPDRLLAGTPNRLRAGTPDRLRARTRARIDVAETTQALLERTGISGIAHQRADTLSTGQARLTELARALATEPRILLLDEPGSGLDSSECQAFGQLLADLAAEGLGILMVEHDMDLVMNVCSRIHVLDFGVKIAEGSPDDVRSDERVQAAYLGSEVLEAR